MDPVKMIDELLPKLSAKELDVLSTRIALLRTSRNSGKSTTEEEAFYNALVSGLGKKISKRQPPFYAFIKQGHYKKFKEAFEGTLDYIELAFRNTRINRPAKLRFYLIATEIVINDFETSPVPLSLKSLINNYGLLPSLMDREFPGYASSGLLPMILKAKYANKKPREENEDYTFGIETSRLSGTTPNRSNTPKRKK